MWKTLSSGGTWQGNLVNKEKDGTLFTEETTISPIHNGLNDIVNYFAVKRDITQELSMQSQLNQAHKMESVGRLAGGVAHDFNNMLCLLMTDVIMPEMNGRELAKTLLASYPHLKCLFMSGNTANVITSHGVLAPDKRFIQKPFSMGDLSAKIRETLDSK